jgi:hypothetical protein
VQHELLPRVSLDVGYYRRTFSNQTVTDNLDVTPADFNEFCITAPSDARLGTVSGSQICGLYDVTPAKAGLASNQIITFAKNYSGDASQTYDGVDVTVNARPTGRVFFQAGVTTGRTVTKNCSVVDNPMSLRFCELTRPFQGNYRVSGGYTFPWQLQVSGVFQSLPANPVAGTGAAPGAIALANYTVSDVTPGITLGRPIATPGGTINNVPLIDPSNYADFGDRVNQLDLRLTKAVRVGRYRIEAMADFYNVFNVAAVQAYTTTYGPQWLAPSSILQAGFMKLGGRLTF